MSYFRTRPQVRSLSSRKSGEEQTALIRKGCCRRVLKQKRDVGFALHKEQRFVIADMEYVIYRDLPSPAVRSSAGVHTFWYFLVSRLCISYPHKVEYGNGCKARVQMLKFVIRGCWLSMFCGEEEKRKMS